MTINTNGAAGAPMGSTLPAPLKTAPDMASAWREVDVDFDTAAEQIIQAHRADGEHRDLPVTDLKTWAVAPHEGKFALVPLARHHAPKPLRTNGFTNLAARLGAPAEFIRKLPAPLQLANMNYLLAEHDESSAATLRLRDGEVAAIVSDRYRRSTLSSSSTRYDLRSSASASSTMYAFAAWRRGSSTTCAWFFLRSSRPSHLAMCRRSGSTSPGRRSHVPPCTSRP